MVSEESEWDPQHMSGIESAPRHFARVHVFSGPSGLHQALGAVHQRALGLMMVFQGIFLRKAGPGAISPALSPFEAPVA